MVFHGRAKHILVEAPIVEVLVPPDLTEEMVQRRTIGLDRWFMSAQPVGDQTAPQLTPQQTTPPTSRQCKKRQRGADDPSIESNTLLANQPPTLVLGTIMALIPKGTPQETRPTNQPVIIGSNVASTSTPPSSGWECTFRLGKKVLPTDFYIRTWRNGLGGQVSDSLE